MISSSSRSGRSPDFESALTTILQQPRVAELQWRQVDRDPQIVRPRDRGSAGLADDPFADRNDKPDFLGQRYERVRGNQAALGMAPAQKRLKADDVLAGEIDDGLIVEFELLGGQCLSKLTLERVPLLHLRVHFALEKPERSASIALGPVKSEIRIAHQLRWAIPVVGADGDANAHPDDHQLRLDLVGRSDRVDDAKRKRRGVSGLRNPYLHDRELIPAHARNGISFPDQRTQPLGHHLEELVASGMAKRIVDGLKVIEIEQMGGD